MHRYLVVLATGSLLLAGSVQAGEPTCQRRQIMRLQGRLDRIGVERHLALQQSGDAIRALLAENAPGAFPGRG